MAEARLSPGVLGAVFGQERSAGSDGGHGSVSPSEEPTTSKNRLAALPAKGGPDDPSGQRVALATGESGFTCRRVRTSGEVCAGSLRLRREGADSGTSPKLVENPLLECA